MPGQPCPRLSRRRRGAATEGREATSALPLPALPSPLLGEPRGRSRRPSVLSLSLSHPLLLPLLASTMSGSSVVSVSVKLTNAWVYLESFSLSSCSSHQQTHFSDSHLISTASMRSVIFSGDVWETESQSPITAAFKLGAWP